MRLSPVAWFGSLVAGATGAGVALLVLGGGHSAPQQPTYQLHQDAQTGSVAVITSAAPTTTAAAPKLAPASTVVVKQPAVQQQGVVVTDPVTPVDSQPAPSGTESAPFFQPIQPRPGNGPSSVNAGSIPTPTDSGS